MPELGYQGVDAQHRTTARQAEAAFGKDPRVIQAFSLSLDREAITKVAFNGEFLPGNQWVKPEESPPPQTNIPGAQARCRQGQRSC